ncbi:hypothetical protein P4S68_19445 [Pseudoalteromonas sp. Hal099]
MTVKYSRSANSAERKPNARPKPNEQPKPDKSYLTANVKSPRCDAVTQSVSNAGFDKSVSVTCDEQYAYIASSTYPDHEVMTGITGTNEQIPVPAKGYAAPIKLNPKKQRQ